MTGLLVSTKASASSVDKTLKSVRLPPPFFRTLKKVGMAKQCVCLVKHPTTISAKSTEYVRTVYRKIELLVHIVEI